MKTLTLTIAVGGSLALAACGGSSSTASDAGPPAATTVAAAVSSSSPSPSHISEALFDNYFGTKTIAGRPGARVRVTLVNKGSNQHNFKIDSQKGVDADLGPGQTKTVTVTIPRSGSVQFYCEYHRGIGMVGTVKAS